MRKYIKLGAILCAMSILLCACSINVSLSENENKPTTTTEENKEFFPIENKGEIAKEPEKNNEIPVEEGTLEVHFIDVGQGDCILIQTETKNVLVDAGDNGTEEKIFDYLKNEKVEVIDYFFLTHPHADHIGGAEEVVENLDVKNIIMPNAISSSATFERLIEAIEEKNLEIEIPELGQIYEIDNKTIEVVSPTIDYEDTNNSSLVLKLVFGESSFLFTGDAEKEVEENIINQNIDVDVDVLKVGHHGSESSSTVNFLNSVSPQYAVISVAEENKYNHPSNKIIERLTNVDSQIYMTSVNGDILFTTNGNGLYQINK